MTHDDLMSSFDRLKAAGCRVPDADREAGLFTEWFRALQSYSAADMEAGLSLLVRDKRDGFWPSLGAIREAIAGATAGRPKDTSCQTCHGTGWVEAPPYSANGGHLYEGVTRCYACGRPPPAGLDVLARQQTRLTSAEWQRWQTARQGHAWSHITTHAEMVAAIRAMQTRMRVMPVALTVED